jgi:maltose alpha-D-glucosyltransferase/alpha-amylase
MQAYGRGLRRRLAPMLGGDRRRLELAYSLLLTLPGTPVLRYGDEIGMGEDLGLPERMAARTPMQWSDAPHGGFTRAERPWLPVVSDPIYGYRAVNVARQLQDPASLLRWMQHAIGVRRRCREFGRGRSDILPTDPAALAVRYSWRGHTAVAVHNFAATPRTVELSLPDAGSARLTSLLGGEGSTADGRGRHRIRIEGHGYRWLRSGDGVEATAPAER